MEHRALVGKTKADTTQSGMTAKIDRTKVAQVYSGNLDLCACGCSGNYGTLESKPRLFNKVLKTINTYNITEYNHMINKLNIIFWIARVYIPKL